MHGHMMTMHNSEYRAAGMRQEKLSEEIVPEEELKKAKKPKGFRHLNFANQEEKNVMDEVDDDGYHYEFIDDDGFCYTLYESKEKGWI